MEQLLQRYIRGEVSEAERQKVASWLDESPEHMREFLALRKLYDLSLWHTENSRERKIRKIGFSPRKLGVELLKVAAILLIGFFVNQRFISTPQEEEVRTQTIRVPAGQRAEVTLSDGTHVWLNSRSSLEFPNRFGEGHREVRLDGEGYFDVHADKENPFTVRTPKYDIQVLGTEFNVKAYSGSELFETALLRGNVKIRAPHLREDMQLQPNEMASAENGVLKRSPIKNDNYLKWIEGLFCFENESIQDLIKKLELYYDTRIEVRRPSLLKHRYSGKFRIQDGIEHVLRVLQLKHQFSYVRDEEKNLIIIQ